MREEKGITIVSLIITVVVMIILTAITVETTENEGIVDTANKAAFVHDINIIIEAFNKERASLKYIDEEVYTIQLNDITDLNSDLKYKYDNSIYMENDKFYISEINIFSDTEIEWLKELQIDYKTP